MRRALFSVFSATTLLVISAFGSLADSSAAESAPPKVLGFERLHGTPALDDLSAGELLLGELNCTSCHQAEGIMAERVDRKVAPILTDVGNRVRPEYLRTFLNDPAGTKPGTTMPQVLASLPEAERKETVEALVHFLAATGEIEHQAPRRANANRGGNLFHTVGCVACHDPRPLDGSPATNLKASISLGTPSRKYTLPGLAKFLEDPLAVRPSARMPHLNLGATDAVAVASFLLNDLDMVTGMQFTVAKGSFDKIPDFGKVKVEATGEAEEFDISVTKMKDHFAIRFDGLLNLPKDGEYEFYIRSDDGSRLTIDDQVIADNDGIHPPAEKSGKKEFKAGTHTVSVEFFEQSGGEELAVEVKLPGSNKKQPLADFIAAKLKTDKPNALSDKPFEPNMELAAKGMKLFASLGCASCHSMKVDGQAVMSQVSAKPLNQLGGQGGCLSATPVPKSIHFPLSEAQHKALATVLKAERKPPTALAGNELVQRQMTTFNCYACHARNEIGGVDEAHDPYFETTTKEMGDEGRLPPPLTGVGAKLKTDWAKKVVAEGPKVRPYILTRMPRFGNNLPTFHTEVAAADVGIVPDNAPFLKDVWEDRKFKAAGKTLVGTQGLGCIKCHVWGDKSVPGIQAMSMTTMTERLKPDWFYFYMINPIRFRPGTRMPTAWPEGKATLPTVLGGDTSKQIQSIWAYLLDGDQASPPVGLSQGAIELVAYDEAIMYRNFIEGAGPRAIGVGYPEKLNLAFDANQNRLALIWQNAFMDAARHWSGRGQGFQPPLGDNVVKFPDVVSFATLAADDTPWPKESARELGYQFRGYRLADKMRPIFLYSLGETQIADDFEPVGADGLFFLRRTITLTNPHAPEKLFFLAAQAGKIEAAGDGNYTIDDNLTLRLGKAKAIVRENNGKKELLIPVEFNNGKATIVTTYDW